MGSTRGWSFQCTSTVREEQVWDHLMKLNSHKSIGPDEMMLPLSIISEKPWLSHKNPVTGKMETSVLLKKKGRNEGLGRSWKQF